MNNAWKEITEELKEVILEYPYVKNGLDDSSIEEAYNTYLSVIKEIDNIDEELDILDKDESVKKYKLLSNKKKLLTILKKELYKKEKEESFSNCKHLWINNDQCGKYCVKCGLNTMYNNMEFINYGILDESDKTIVDYLYNNSVKNGKDINIEFDDDKELIRNIYFRLRTLHPKISEITIIKYLNASLFNINTKDVSEKKDIKRKERLKERNKENGFM